MRPASVIVIVIAAAAPLVLGACADDKKMDVVRPSAQQQLARGDIEGAPQGGSMPRICANGMASC